MPAIHTIMPKIKIRPADMAKIHRTKPPGEYGPCEMHYCSCPEFQENQEAEDDCANCHHGRRYHTKSVTGQRKVERE